MAIRKTMNVSLAPELERYVVATVASGRYRSASEVVRAPLRLLERQEPAGIDLASRSPVTDEGAEDHAG